MMINIDTKIEVHTTQLLLDAWTSTRNDVIWTTNLNRTLNPINTITSQIQKNPTHIEKWLKSIKK